MMKQTITILVLVVALCGCMKYIISEPLPAVMRKPVAPSALPPKVVAAIAKVEPEAPILKIVGWKFKRKFTQYDVTVRSPQGERTYHVSPDGTHCERNKEQESTQPTGARDGMPAAQAP